MKRAFVRVVAINFLILAGCGSAPVYNYSKELKAQNAPAASLLYGDSSNDTSDYYEASASPCLVRDGSNSIQWMINASLRKFPHYFCRVGVDSCNIVREKPHEVIEEVYACKDGKRHGKYEAYALRLVGKKPMRDLKVEANFKEGQLEGTSDHYSTVYDTQKSVVTLTKRYEQGRLVEKFYHGGESGRREKWPILNQRLHGSALLYFREGLTKEPPRVEQEVPYVNGRIHGTRRTYDRSGTLILEEPFKDGVRSGTSKQYRSGELIREDTYDQDLWISGRYLESQTGKWRNEKKEKEKDRSNDQKSSKPDFVGLLVSPYLTAGIGGGHAGIAGDIGLGFMSGESFGGFYLSGGVRSGSPNVYSLGIGAGGAYMLSLFGQADLLVREGRIGGGTLTAGMGLTGAFLIGRAGYDSFSGLPVIEVGATVKLPLLYFRP